MVCIFERSMKKFLIGTVLMLTFMCGCLNKESSNEVTEKESDQNSISTPQQLGEYIVEIFEDSKGNLWFGTMNNGVIRFDGNQLEPFYLEKGIAGNAVVAIVEDEAENLWFGTHSGLSKFDGKTFTNFYENDGLCHNRVSNLLIDKDDQLWIGTWSGICVYDGTSFADFPLPQPDINSPLNRDTKDWTTEIMQDSKGNIWFGRDGYGACRYNSKSKEKFEHVTKEDGLPSNNVQSIMEDSQGNIWFTTRVAERDHPDADKRSGEGGLGMFDGKSFMSFDNQKGLSKNDIYTIYEDRAGSIWIGATGHGVYKYENGNFQLFNKTDRPDLNSSFGLQSALEDKDDRLWLGFSGGLFRLEDSTLVNINTNGPW